MTRVVAAAAWIGTCSHCLGIALHVTNVPLNAALLAVSIIEFGSLEYISWPTTVYLVASILLSVSSTRLRRRLGSRKAYLIAGRLFGKGSLICGVTRDTPVLLIGNSVQVAGGGGREYQPLSARPIGLGRNRCPCSRIQSQASFTSVLRERPTSREAPHPAYRLDHPLDCID